MTKQEIRPDAPDSERTDTAAFTGQAGTELAMGAQEQYAVLEADEDAAETPDDDGANTDDETPPPAPEPEPDTEPEPEPEPEPAA